MTAALIFLCAVGAAGIAVEILMFILLRRHLDNLDHTYRNGP